MLLAVFGCGEVAGGRVIQHVDGGPGATRHEVPVHPERELRGVVAELCLDVQAPEADVRTGKILAQRAVTAFSWGENVVIFVEDVGGRARTRVEVVSRAALASNVTATNCSGRG